MLNLSKRLLSLVKRDTTPTPTWRNKRFMNPVIWREGCQESFHRKVCPKRGISTPWLSATLAGWRRPSCHVRFKPDLQGAARLQCFVSLGQFLVLWRVGMGLLSQSSYLAWFARRIPRRIFTTTPAGGNVWASKNGMGSERE